MNIKKEAKIPIPMNNNILLIVVQNYKIILFTPLNTYKFYRCVMYKDYGLLGVNKRGAQKRCPCGYKHF